MAISVQIPFVGNRQSSAVVEAQKAASKAAQSALAPYFWPTVWLPFCYLWTLGWMIEPMIAKRFEDKIKPILERMPALAGVDLDQIDFKKIDLFSVPMKISMVLMDFAYFMALMFFIAVIAYFVCHGDGSVLGRFAAWTLRGAARLVTFNGINFDFCSQIPLVN